jgi:iron complex transport system ATP-binding protein
MKVFKTDDCIRASGLSAGYKGIPVFRDFDIGIPAGKITTLIGANGSGKSTILKTMTRLIEPFAGTVYLEGKSIHTMPTKLAAQKLALLPQGAQIPRGITVRDLAEYGRFPYRTMLSGLSAKDREIVEWALQAANMTELSEREMDQLSGGQRQRGWIAMALAQKTGVLFLDEPTTYLDVSHQLDILQLLQRLNKEQGVTVVMVLHDLNQAAMFSDYIVAIKDGVKKYAGPPDEVVTPEMLADIFNVQAAVIRHPALDVPVCLPYRVCK